MEFSVDYKGFLNLTSDIQAGRFSLKPSKRRTVPAELKEMRRFQMADELLQALETELLSNNVTLGLEIYTLYKEIASLRRSHWTLTTCQVVAKTPLTSNSRPGTLLSKDCDQHF